MAIDHSLEVRRAVVARLRSDIGVTALVGDRIYDDPPADPIWPFIRYGVPIVGNYEATRLEGSTHRITIHAFDKGPGTAGAMKIGAAVVAAMKTLAFADLSIIDLEWMDTRILNDPSTRGAYHAVVEFQLITAELD